MTGKYDDIINLPHHQSRTRSHMTNGERAAQFSPFAALTGFDGIIDEKTETEALKYDESLNGTREAWEDDA